jgi:hypothetical protein
MLYSPKNRHPGAGRDPVAFVTQQLTSFKCAPAASRNQKCQATWFFCSNQFTNTQAQLMSSQKICNKNLLAQSLSPPLGITVLRAK